MCLAVAPFLITEAVLRGIDWPKRTARDDPFVDLHALRPLFTPTDDGASMEIGEERRNWFDHDAFLKKKPARTRRCFVLGGSTVQGEPYHKESAYPTWLKLQLHHANQDQAWEVINCGGVSYASYRLSVILEEVLQYEPDLIILDCGHNEFLEERTYADWSRVPTPIARVVGSLSTCRMVQAGRLICFGEQPPRNATKLQTEVDAQLDHPQGLQQYHRDDAWRSAVISHFQLTADRMIQACKKAHVPLVLCIPASNLRDTPPFKIQADPTLSESDRATLEAHWTSACQRDLPIADRMEHCQQCLTIDTRHAGAAFLLGRLLEHQRDYEQAKEWFNKARDWDVCPLRITSEMERILRDLANQNELPVVDYAEQFARESPHGIPGGAMFVDHVHPSIPGHRKIADALFQTLSEHHLIEPQSDATERAQDAMRAHALSLDEAYYHHGQQRLEGLLRWANGRAKAMGE